MMFIGIDVGKKGGIAVITEQYIKVFPYSDDTLNAVCNLAYKEYKSHCTVEMVHAMPNQGVTSMFNFGKSFGYILGVLDANGIKYNLVSPQKWKKEYDLLNTDKKASIEKCKQIFPDISLLPTKRSRVDSDGMAESLLICNYGRLEYERRSREKAGKKRRTSRNTRKDS